ncbi:MAG: DoxX family protein [Gemmatimonadales bacterium]
MPAFRTTTILSWVAQLIAAAILATAGGAKLAGAADPVALFTLLGVEPWGRLLLGTFEVLTTLLLLWPRTAALGGLLGAGLMLGAIGTHLFKIGITYGGDPSLFILACVVLIACLATVWLRRRIRALST